MEEKRYWWIQHGYIPFEAGTDAYPRPGQVIRHYRTQKSVHDIPWTQADLGRLLGISEKSVWAMEHHDAGLDSFKRRVILATELHIPPALLKLDSASLLTTSASRPPGQIVWEYRKKKRKEDGKCWTQTDLAEVLKISEKAIRAMENRNTGLDSLSRREALITILDIPPALLGLDALHFFSRYHIEETKPRLPRQVTLDQEKLTTYRLLVSSFWETHYTSNAPESVEAIERVIRDLRNMIPYVNEQQQHQLKELLSQYHQLALNTARDQGDHTRAMAHARFAIILAEKTGNREAMAAALYRRGLTFFDMENFQAAARDLNDALSFAPYARPQLRGMVLMEAGRFNAYVAQNHVERMYVYKLFDQTANIVRQRVLEDDEGYVKLDRGRYHIGRAAALLTLRRIPEALEELDEADALTKTEQLRRHAYINILRARAYVAQGEFAFATDIALEALTTCIAIHSESNIADISKLYGLLSHTPFGNSPLVVHLGLMLRSHRR